MTEEKIEKWLQTASHFFKQGKLIQAMQLYNQILEKDETHLDAIFEKGKIFLEQKNFNEAESTFAKGSQIQDKLKEKDYPFKQFQAIVLVNKDDDEKIPIVLKLLEESLMTEGGNIDEKLLLQAVLLFKSGQLEKALDSLRQTSHSFDKKKQCLRLTALIFYKLRQEKHLEVVLNNLSLKKLETFEVKVDF